MKARIFSSIVALSMALLGASSAFADAAVVPLSSGIKNQFYSIEWCSPHYGRLDGAPATPCRAGQFQVVGWVATIKYNGIDFPSGNAIPSNLLTGTRTNETITGNPPLVSFFSNATAGAFSIEGEGVLTLRAFMVDYADNTSFYKIIYKVDKTGPQLTFTDITENTDYTHYGGRLSSAASTSVAKNDGSYTVSSGDSYSNPIMSTYAGNHVATARLVHTRAKLHSFYFQNTTTGLGANSDFTPNTAFSDTYGTYLTASASSPIAGGYSGPLVADVKNFQLLAADGSPLKNLPGTTVSLKTSDLQDNSLENSQKMYRLRLYDNTVDSSGATGNYSETAFYVVRDNTAPNMGGNGLASTAESASESLLSFADGQTVFDKTAYSNGYTPSANGVSRFFAAAQALPLSYKISDIGVVANGGNPNTSCTGTEYWLCNAGLDTATTAIKIEDADAPSSIPTFVSITDRFANTGTQNKHFDKVCTDSVCDTVSNGTYRKYATQFVSNGQNKLCDYVGNCLDPKLDFRVVANSISTTASTFTIASQTASADGKIVANGSHAYKVSYTLRDAHGNHVVPVKSLENSGTPEIKAVDTSLSFFNGLNENQLRNSGGTGNKLVTAVNSRGAAMSFTDQINSTGNVSLSEQLTPNPTGTYEIALSSAVPTKSAYPYLNDQARLYLQSLATNTDRILTASGWMSYPSSGTRMGYSNGTTVMWSGNPFVTIDSGEISENQGERLDEGYQDLHLKAADYGKITYNTASNVAFSALNSRLPNFEFASPYVYGLIGMRVLIDWQYADHYKKLYTIDSSLPYNVYEKYVVAYNTNKDEQPGVLDYRTRRNSSSTVKDISAGVRYTSNGNLPIFGSSMEYHPYDIAGATGSGFSAEVQMNSRLDRMPYDMTKLRTGFVSAITYEVGWSTIQLPSVGRWLTKLDGVTPQGQYEAVRNFFDDTYTIGNVSTAPATLTANINNIAIIGLSNRYNTLTTDANGSEKNVNVEGELNRTTLVTSIKQNVASVSRWFAAKTNTSASKRWCSGGVIGQSFLNLETADSQACSIDVNGETITFIDGNTTLDCGATCRIGTRKGVVVKNGSLYVKSNISTLSDSGTQTDGQLFLGVMHDTGLANVTIDPNTPDITAADKSGWMFIDPSITNLDTFLFAQGPIISYSDAENVFYTEANTTERRLRNQLYINGSILSLNTIGGKIDTVCPYIVDNCTSETAQMFDLIYTRRFSLVGRNIYPPYNQADTSKVPYHPDGPEIAKKAGGLTGTNSVSTNELRYVDDPNYYPYPLVIERDLRWNSSSTTSRLFQTNN